MIQNERVRNTDIQSHNMHRESYYTNGQLLTRVFLRVHWCDGSIQFPAYEWWKLITETTLCRIEVISTILLATIYSTNRGRRGWQKFS